MYRKTVQIFSAVTLVCAMGNFQNANAWDPWLREATILARISAPTFSSAYTNVGIGTYPRTNIQTAIDNLSAAGGGKVILNATGTYLCKGPIVLKNNVNLQINSGATLKFDYPTLDGNTISNYFAGPGTSGTYLTKWEGTWVYKRAPMIYAYNQTNIAVTGAGTIDANKTGGLDGWDAVDNANVTTLRGWGWSGTAIASRVMGDASRLRPGVIEPVMCKNILIDGITILNSCWWQIHPISCTNVKISNCKPNSGTQMCGDGIDIEGCNDVLVEKCQVTTGDDAIVIKSGRDNDGWASSPMGQKMSEDIVIRQCNLMNKGGGGVSVGSEVSGGVRNVFVSQCSTNVAQTSSHFIFIKTVACRGGSISNFNVRNCVNTKGTTYNAIRVDPKYKQADCVDSIYPTDIHDISISGIDQDVISGGQGVRVVGYNTTCRTRNVTLTNVDIATVATPGIDTAMTANIIFSNVDLGSTDYTFTRGALVSVTGVALNSSSQSLAVGGTYDLTETVSPTNATNKEILWTSSNTSVATVDYSGVVKAIANGTATITAMSQNDNTKTATCAVTVGVNGNANVTALADASCRGGSYATVNYGTDIVAKTKYYDGVSANDRKVFIKFDLTGKAACTIAKLKWYVEAITTDVPVTLDIDKIDVNTWTETGITWNNAPATVATHITSTKTVSTTGWQELDITSLVNAEISSGDKIFTIRIAGTTKGLGDRYMTMTSKDGASNKPYIELTGGQGKRAAGQESAAPLFANAEREYISMNAGMIMFFSDIDRNISIVNMSGRTLLSKRIGANQTFMVPQASLARGVYFLRMVDNNHNNISKKITIAGR